jgi:hypothetical protein
MGTRLITGEEGEQVLTAVRETDTRTALTRGLKEYLESLQAQTHDGQLVRLEKVFQTWAEPEQPATIPSACVYSPDPGVYDESSFTPVTKVLPDGTLLRMPSEFVQRVFVDVWATDPKQRVALSALLEQAFNPVEWMFGFRLELPHYHGVRADFTPKSMAYLDDAGDAQRRVRRFVFAIEARGPNVVYVGKRPKMQIRVDLAEVTDAPSSDPASIGYDVRVDPALGTASGPTLGHGVDL